jgi:cytoplasmic iron level regulating protein YaaA (DUF328/UPF0246 family)
MSGLLLLSCSSSKLTLPAEPIPAIERYTGVFFKVLNKWIREHPHHPRPDLLIISAQFGLLRPEALIPYYDQRMNVRLAVALAPKIQTALQQELTSRRYRSILVNLGRDYLKALEGFNGLQGATWAQGSIGVRARQLKNWLNETEV